MSCGLSLIIKNYYNGGGDLTLKLTGAQYSEQAANAGTRLIVTRKPDKHSSRLGMFAYLRKSQPGYQSLGFFEMTLQYVKCSDAGAILSIVTNVFFDIGVESVKPDGTEEKITFVAREKDRRISGPLIRLDGTDLFAFSMKKQLVQE